MLRRASPWTTSLLRRPPAANRHLATHLQTAAAAAPQRFDQHDDIRYGLLWEAVSHELEALTFLDHKQRNGTQHHTTHISAVFTKQRLNPPSITEVGISKGHPYIVDLELACLHAEEGAATSDLAAELDLETNSATMVLPDLSSQKAQYITPNILFDKSQHSNSDTASGFLDI